MSSILQGESLGSTREGVEVVKNVPRKRRRICDYCANELNIHKREKYFTKSVAHICVFGFFFVPLQRILDVYNYSIVL